MAFSALRFTSVLIGVGLLLRTASAEYVVSAPQGAAPQPESRRPVARPPARLALPKPDFGQPAQAHERVSKVAVADAASVAREPHQPRREAAHKAALASASSPIAETSAAGVSASLVPVAEAKLAREAGAAAAVKPAVRSATEAPHIAATNAAQPAPPRPQVAGAGLLAPVRVVSGTPSPAPTKAVPAATPPAAQPVQISLAPPVMRPGPRTTVLTTDVRAEMRRPASAWDYAEALPPELSGRPAAAPRQAASAQPATPPVQLAMPTPILASQPKSAPAPVTREAAMAADQAKPLRQKTAPAAAPRKTAAAASTSPVAAARVASPSADKKSPHVLALLDQPSPVDQPRTAAALPISDQRRNRVAVLERARSSRLLADKRRYRMRGAHTAEPVTASRQAADDKIKTLSAVEAPLEVSPDQRSSLGGSVLADASASEISLRDRIPHPAF